jgi:transcription antitermination factor NusA-like protein
VNAIPVSIVVPGALGIVVLVALFLITHAKQADILYALVCRLGADLFRWWGSLYRWLEKKQVAAEVQAFINVHTEPIAREAPGVLPYTARVEYVGAQDVLEMLKEGEVILRMKRHANQEQNIVNATLLYLSKGLLPRARRHLAPDLRKATDYVIAQKVFDSSRESGASSYFIEHVLEPALRESELLREMALALGRMDAEGTFTRIYLSEILEMGERLPTLMVAEGIEMETVAFVRFLADLSERAASAVGALDYRGARLKISLLLVARKGKLEEEGLGPYIRRLNRFIAAGTPGIYICARGDHNVQSVLRLVKYVHRLGMLSVLQARAFEMAVDGQRMPAIICACTTNTGFLERQQRDRQPVDDALASAIPEVRTGEWTIMRTVRRVGYGSKVAVRIAGELDTPGAIRDATSRPGAMAAVRERLGGENVHLVPWSPIPEEFITAALDPLGKCRITGVDVDQTEVTARVIVETASDHGMLVGKNGWNVQAAADLTGWEIDIVTGDARHREHPPHVRALIEAILETVPEVEKGELRIEGVARTPGVGSKILVRHESGGDAVGPCVGLRNRRLEEIRKRLPGEWINFVSWSEDPVELIVRALFPLPGKKVQEVILDEVTRRATVRVSDEAAAQKAVGAGSSNLLLAEKATNWSIRVQAPGGVVHETTAPSATQLVIDTLAGEIPAIASGELEVVRAVVDPGYSAKVAVRWAAGGTTTHEDPVEAFLGNHHERLAIVKRILGVGGISVVPWTDDLARLVVLSLYPLDARSVLDTRLDESSSSAVVVVRELHDVDMAVGLRGRNVRLAERMLGLRIEVRRGKTD